MFRDASLELDCAERLAWPTLEGSHRRWHLHHTLTSSNS